MRRPLRLLYAFAGLAVLLALCATLGLEEFRRALSRASPLSLAGFLSLSVLVFLTYAWRWSLVLGFLGAPRVPLANLLLYRASGHAAGTLVPSAQLSGDPVRAFLLRRRGVDWPTAILGVAIDRLLEMTASAIAGPIYVAFFLHATGMSPRIASWIFAGMALGLAGLALVYWSAARRGGAIALLVRRGLLPKLPDAARAAGDRFADFVRSPTFAAAFGLSLLVEALLVAEFFALTRAFGIELPLPTIGAILVGMGLSALAPIPGALGSLEAVQVGVARIAGGAADLGLAIGLLIRLRDGLWVVVGAVTLYVVGFRRRSPSAESGKASAIEPKEYSARSR
ncbi:MAG: lysylphosphatidylglycerol synthase transmembrane domain-containing protein [Candidatus Binatia bacterium]